MYQVKHYYGGFVSDWKTVYVKRADRDAIRIERLDNSIRASLEGFGFSGAHGRQLELLATDDMA